VTFSTFQFAILPLVPVKEVAPENMALIDTTWCVLKLLTSWSKLRASSNLRQNKIKKEKCVSCELLVLHSNSQRGTPKAPNFTPARQPHTLTHIICIYPGSLCVFSFSYMAAMDVARAVSQRETSSLKLYWRRKRPRKFVTALTFH